MESPADIYRILAEERAPVVLATVVSAKGSSPGKPGFKMLVYPDGRTLGTVGGGLLEEEVKRDAQAAIRGGLPELKSYSLTENATGMWCGGEVTVLLEPLMPQPTLWIFGYGNLGSEVRPLLDGLPFYPVVVHDEAVAGITSTLIDWESLEPFPEVCTDDYVLVLTMDAKREMEIIARLASSPPRYVGVVGSRTKANKMQSRLKEQGVSTEGMNLHIPVGLSIGARTTKEIAVSIIAGLIKERNAA